MPFSPTAGVVTFEDARHIVEQHAVTVARPNTESVELLEANGRVLAETILADRDFPPFRRAARDGYAVRAADLGSLPATLSVVCEIRAGASLEDMPRQIGLGQAAAIMTGAPAPEGADAIVMVEYTTMSGDQVTITRGVQAGENIIPKGAEARSGQELLEGGTRINEACVAVIASVGKVKAPVYVKPKVAVLSTGDEIVPVDAVPGTAQIRNSNSYSLAAQIQSAGGAPITLPIAPDEPKRLRELIQEGFKADLLLLAGGVSMGKYDLVEQVLGELGAEFFFTGAQIQPGKPIVFGKVQPGSGMASSVVHPRRDVPLYSERKYFFGLPGNPVSTMVTFDLFARPLIEALSGMRPRKLAFASVRLKSEIRTKTGLKRFLPANLSGEFEQAEVELVRWGGSGDIAATARANCYIVVPPDLEKIAAGEFVSVVLRQCL